MKNFQQTPKAKRLAFSNQKAKFNAPNKGVVRPPVKNGYFDFPTEGAKYHAFLSSAYCA